MREHYHNNDLGLKNLHGGSLFMNIYVSFMIIHTNILQEAKFFF
jgi:hypothetical protein